MNDHPRNSPVGLRLTRLREHAGYSQAALAKALGISASYLNQIEKNKRPLTAAIQQRLSQVLGTLGSLFDHDQPAALQQALAETAGSAAVTP